MEGGGSTIQRDSDHKAFQFTQNIWQVDQEQLYLLFLTTTKIEMKTIVFDSISF